MRRSDLTRPTPRQERLLPKRIGYTVLTLALLLVIGSFANSFLVLPVRSWFGQRSEFEDRTVELETLREATDRLQAEVDRLNTPEGVEDAARLQVAQEAVLRHQSPEQVAARRRQRRAWPRLPGRRWHPRPARTG